MTILAPMRVMEIFNHENVDKTMKNSPVKLNVGCKTRLVRLHHIAFRRGTDCKLQAKIIV